MWKLVQTTVTSTFNNPNVKVAKIFPLSTVSFLNFEAAPEWNPIVHEIMAEHWTVWKMFKSSLTSIEVKRNAFKKKIGHF